MANVRRFATLLDREAKKFMNSKTQTILAPVISSLLYLVVFGRFIGSQIPEVNGFSYMEFLIPGVIMMSVVTNSYFNSSLSLLISKFFNNLTEVLTAPPFLFRDGARAHGGGDPERLRGGSVDPAGCVSLYPHQDV